ncbi:iron complex outermembrane recepter protein [Fibrisoma limi BUZ 3]|uniref:Iron complex outermembrane recepter protein n=1 Tax=Fibrisoma limi BUZ 3 TaxID=1185876 RepID=I2GPB5_9BACT|nr:TonB-dependent receptor [Fibrisoma limi]CCH55743.1 iron complex outermembrane recepter protein [Fibrisoma limi BUZ 3]
MAPPLRILLTGFLGLPQVLLGQLVSNDTSQFHNRVFRLGEVTVSGQRSTDSVSQATIRHIEAFNRTDAARALSLLPGVTLASVGARNESVVFVRGFDLRQVPVFIDGVPVYVPYDGYVDLARFTTFDLSEINVSKGFTSVVYGPNTLGGAINLVSRRPQQRLEFDGRAGLLSGRGHRLNLNIGSNLGKFYVQGSASQFKQSTFPLSADFTPKPLEDGGDRDNAFRDDVKYTLKAGFTPNATDEYAISYVNQQGAKGTPPYVGSDPLQRARFWRWPYWDKESWYFISRTALSTNSYVKARLYYDRFKNRLDAYDDATYTTQRRPSSFQSFYNDDTYGGLIEYGNQLTKQHSLRASIHYKQDRHRENNAGEPVRTFIDNTMSIGLEDVFSLGKGWSLVPGISLNTRNNLRAENYDSNTKRVTDFADNDSQAFNGQLGLFYAPTQFRQLSLTAARQTRFATIKDRYSFRLGAAIPNPDLKAESALHYELAYGDRIARLLQVKASVFYSRITDVIQQVNNVQPNIFQLQNTGEAEFYGAELSMNVPISTAFQTGVQYSYLERKNLSNPTIQFIDVPNHKLLLYAVVQPIRRVSLVGSLDYNSARYSTSYGIRAAAYTLVNARASVQLIRYVAIEGGVNNLFDRNYALVEGFPEAGRNYFVNLVITKR